MTKNYAVTKIPYVSKTTIVLLSESIRSMQDVGKESNE